MHCNMAHMLLLDSPGHIERGYLTTAVPNNREHCLPSSRNNLHQQFTHACLLNTITFCIAGPGRAPLGKPDWAHVFLTVLDPLPLHEAGQQHQAAAALRAACAGVMSKHSSALRKAGVAQWELRLRMPQGLPAWRVVVSSPTGEPH